MSKIINDAALDQIFRQARTHRSWTADPVSDVVLQAAYDLARMAPTSANCSPMRILFLKSKETKAPLLPMLLEGNRAKTMQAPVTTERPGRNLRAAGLGVPSVWMNILNSPAADRSASG